MKPRQPVTLGSPIEFTAPCPSCKSRAGSVDIMGGVYVVLCRCGRRVSDIKGKPNGQAAAALRPDGVTIR